MTRAMSCRGPIIRTFAPRLRSVSVSSAAVLPAIARSIPNGDAIAMSRLAIGFRQSTWVARAAGAMSRFVLLHTAAVDVLAPGDLNRREDPRHRAGRLHGLGDGGGGRARRAEDDAPAVGAVDGDDAQAPVEAGAGPVDALADLRQRRVAAGCAAEQRGAQRGAAVGAGGERHRRQRRRRRPRQADRLAGDALQDGAWQRQPLRREA